MDNLITVITRFQLPAGVTADQIRQKFHVDPTIEFYDSPVIVENYILPMRRSVFSIQKGLRPPAQGFACGSATWRLCVTKALPP